MITLCLLAKLFVKLVLWCWGLQLVIAALLLGRHGSIQLWQAVNAPGKQDGKVVTDVM